MQPASPPPPPAKPRANAWRWAFRIFRWSTYLGAIVSLVLLLHQAPPPTVEASPQIAAQAEQKMEAVQLAVQQGQPAELHLNESELNSFLATHLNLASEPWPNATPSAAEIQAARSAVRDLKLQLLDGRIRAYLLFDFHGKDLTLQLEGKLSSANSFIRFDPVSGELGSFPIPQSALQTAMQRVLDSPENRETFRLPPNVADLRIVNGEIVVTYR